MVEAHADDHKSNAPIGPSQIKWKPATPFCQEKLRPLTRSSETFFFFDVLVGFVSAFIHNVYKIKIKSAAAGHFHSFIQLHKKVNSKTNALACYCQAHKL